MGDVLVCRIDKTRERHETETLGGAALKYRVSIRKDASGRLWWQSLYFRPVILSVSNSRLFFGDDAEHRVTGSFLEEGIKTGVRPYVKIGPGDRDLRYVAP